MSGIIVFVGCLYRKLHPSRVVYRTLNATSFLPTMHILTNLCSIRRQLAPGAATLLKKVTADSLSPEERLSPKSAPRALTAKEWKVLVEAFAEWPFKPDVCHHYCLLTIKFDQSFVYRIYRLTTSTYLRLDKKRRSSCRLGYISYPLEVIYWIKHMRGMLMILIFITMTRNPQTMVGGI